ncbi:adenylate/guanylate cyclase domain-containing protein [Aliarcobacter butzleri]|uniref:adenylate/guanylate cyclase domain-containing protein n=1 Tax=Aliarcobacter butzleri TaxID=28197 RepID=UPI0012FC3FC1|nr:adenylate/guanylate cyclase domain-containing protein [Aliarcobacter butzleri]
MEATHSIYDFNKSILNFDEILNSSDSNYDTHKGIPNKSNLTFTNGYYVDVTVLFIDIRGSKELSTKHTRPVLAKIYRAYISEVISVINGNPYISEINVEGDGIWAVFNTTSSSDVDTVFQTVYTLSSLVDILNVKLFKKGYSQINIGIGVDKGESLFIKAGYKGSGINEVVWLGKVVGQTAFLCSNANKNSNFKIMVSDNVYNCLTVQNKSLLQRNWSYNCYHGNIHRIDMNNWVEDNKK